MKFKAKLIGATRNNTTVVNQPTEWTTFLFTRSKILYLNDNIMNDSFSIGKGQKTILRRTQKYIFSKEYDTNDKKKFKVSLTNQDDTPYWGYLDINAWNKIKCNVLHKRYLVQSESEWFVKMLMTSLVAFLFSLVGIFYGFRQGKESGIQEGRQQIQDSIRLQKQ